MKQHGDGLESLIFGATDPSCSCTVYILCSKFAVISTKNYMQFSYTQQLCKYTFKKRLNYYATLLNSSLAKFLIMS